MNYLLSIELTLKESEALILAKKQLEASTYLPRVVSALKITLTPLALKQTMTKEMSDFYHFINKASPENKNLGGSLISSWGRIF
ncbi:bacteriocin immunity protein [Lactococcus ileimucosae]|uniref:Bacteriocin immunity protein n=1 Tax=Lactococcus ileimucosae TaxID=2941329 RepID=A0ABV4CZZ5_9LACT